MMQQIGAKHVSMHSYKQSNPDVNLVIIQQERVQNHVSLFSLDAENFTTLYQVAEKEEITVG